MEVTPNTRFIVVLGMTVLIFGSARAQQGPRARGGSPPAAVGRPDDRPTGEPRAPSWREPYDAGFSFSMDNDLLALGDDVDYTGGIVLTFAGRRAIDAPLSLDRALTPLDRFVPYPDDDADRAPLVLHTQQFALFAFTPDDLNASYPIHDDRPYASYLGVANMRTFIRDDASPVYETSLEVGILGLDVAKALQRGLHKGLNLDEMPQGWDYQISDGGEPTFRVGWGRQALLRSRSSGGSTFDAKWRMEANVGYITEASFAINARWGRINTPWWSMSPGRNAYVSQPYPVAAREDSRGSGEVYVWGGMKARFPAYNVFLQGQFRDSEVRYAASDVERAVLEAWLGVTWQLPRGVRLSYFLRYQSPELEVGRGNRGMRWAGFTVSR